MQARYGAGAASPLRGVTPDPRQPGPASHLDRRKRGLVSRVTGPPDVMPGPHFEGRGFPAVGERPERRRFGSNTRRGEVLRSRLPLYGTAGAPGYGGKAGVGGG